MEALGRMASRSDVGVHIISAADHAVLGRWFEFVPVTLWASTACGIGDGMSAAGGVLSPSIRTGPPTAGVPRAIHRQDSGFLRRGALDRVRVALRPDESRDRAMHEHGNCSRCFRKPEMRWASL